jgi:hypothetical protein
VRPGIHAVNQGAVAIIAEIEINVIIRVEQNIGGESLTKMANFWRRHENLSMLSIHQIAN